MSRPPDTPPPARAEGVSSRRLVRLTAAALTLVAATYLLQLVSPLRLNHDAVRLLSMGWNAHAHGTYLVDGQVEEYPPGYPFMLKLLFDAGLGRTAWLGLLNLTWLGAAAAGWFWIARHHAGLPVAAARLATLLPLLSWCLIKHAVIPLTDLPYLGLSTLALVFLHRYWSATTRFAWRDLTIAVILSLTALQVRTVGVALLAAIAASVACHPLTLRLIPARLQPTSRQMFIAALVALGTFLALAQTDWLKTRVPSGYPQSLITFVRGESAVTPTRVLTWRLNETSALALNLPLPAGRGFLTALPGLVVWVALLFALPRGWNRLRPWIFYAGFYAGILLLWPFTDPRFLLPLLPLASLLAVLTVPPLVAASRPRRLLVFACLGCFIALGLAALAYSTRLSLAGADFARRYGLPDVRATYAQAFGLPPQPGSPPPNERWVEFLRRIEPRAQPAAPGSP